MNTELISEPALIYEYLDEIEGFKGWLVIDSLDHKLCAGGMRVQPGLDSLQLIRLARNMTRKMRISNIHADGAKSGIDYDPKAPGREAAVTRFIKAIRPYIESRYSMGPDLNIEMAELERAAASLGISSVKMAIARAMVWEMPYFQERYAILNRQINGSTLGRLRAGTGVAAAALQTIDFLDIPRREATVAVQGFGKLAKAAISGLISAGVKIIAVADANKCIASSNAAGIEMTELLKVNDSLLPDTDYGDSVSIMPKEAVFSAACDILVPAAVEGAISSGNATLIKARAVVPGANLAVSDDGEKILSNRSILVLPDFLAGSGGSLSMAGLFGPDSHPEATAVLAFVRERMSEMVTKVLNRSAREGISPTAAALKFCAETVPQPEAKPYG